MSRRHTKTVVDVEVVEVVPVAIRTARVPIIIVEGTTAQNPAVIFGEPCCLTTADVLYIQTRWGGQALPRPLPQISEIQKTEIQKTTGEQEPPPHENRR
jgi:hypothetical protein